MNSWTTNFFPRGNSILSILVALFALSAAGSGIARCRTIGHRESAAQPYSPPDIGIAAPKTACIPASSPIRATRAFRLMRSPQPML